MTSKHKKKVKNSCNIILKSSLVFSFLMIFGWNNAQEKKIIEHTYTLFKDIKPNEKLDYWAVYFFDGDNFQLLKQVGAKKDIEKSETGFLKSSADNSYYYIITEKAGKKNMITDDAGLKKFIGKIDNVQEVTILLLLKGYFIDEEYQSIAGNYSEDKENYYLHLGQISSENCPFAKQSVSITIDKTTGIETKTDVGKVYFEKYRKECKNNPHQQYKLNIKKQQ